MYLEANEASSSNPWQLNNEQHVYNSNAGRVDVLSHGLIVLIDDDVAGTRNQL